MTNVTTAPAGATVLALCPIWCSKGTLSAHEIERGVDRDFPAIEHVSTEMASPCLTEGGISVVLVRSDVLTAAGASLGTSQVLVSADDGIYGYALLSPGESEALAATMTIAAALLSTEIEAI